MSIDITDGSTTVQLPEDLLWTDEFTWSPVQQTVSPTVTGAQVVQVGALTGGRQITLQPQDESSAWISYVALSQLQTWAQQPGLQLQITIRGITRDVIFRHQDRALEVTKVAHYSDFADDDWFLVVVRLMENAA